MKWYIASRTANADRVDALQEKLEALDQEVVSDWTSGIEYKPYAENPALCEKGAERMIAQVCSCDGLILLSDAGGTGMFIEMGAALAKRLRVIVVGEHNTRSLFFFHPLVERVRTDQDVIDALGNKA